MREIAWGVVMSAAVAVAACGGGPKAPPRDAVLESLQKEAASMKADGEKGGPSLGVESTWVIEGVDLEEQPGDPAKPWKGVIRFKIVTRMRDPDGTTTEDELKKSFQYVYDNTAGKWQIHYVPPK